MSANDSASLIDSPKASNLGLHRALFYNEHEGSLETFRPYASPTRNGSGRWRSVSRSGTRRHALPSGLAMDRHREGERLPVRMAGLTWTRCG